MSWFEDFLETRFSLFGDYEDALSSRGPLLFHSVLSPMLNIGLLTPDEVVDAAVRYAEQHDVPINSLEGFLRQIVGWREFVRGVYRHYSEDQEKENFWGHHRAMKPCWWDGTTGLRPLDDAIRKVVRYGWCHHIERLMVLCNLMNLCEIDPPEAHDWFLSMFVDASDWVMGPNVYGMGLMSDGGLFATKPYICGSNYILKMSDYHKPKPGDPDWCVVFDGLYWRFIDRHRAFFESNPRMSMTTRTLDRMDAGRRATIYSAADAFLEEVTLPAVTA